MRRYKGDYISHFSAVAAQIVGRTHEIETILATLAAGKHIILEGPPGTTKSTILKAITQVMGLPLYYVAGSGDLTPAKLIGHFNPARIAKDTYRPYHFNEGPLIHAMRGGFLFIEEFNRVPADTANVLVTAVAEGELNVPRYGIVRAKPDFRVVCSHNPQDDVGTVRISRALYDRFCRLRIDYQSLEEDLKVLRRTVGSADETINLVAVHLIHATRHHKDIRQGASIRGGHRHGHALPRPWSPRGALLRRTDEGSHAHGGFKQDLALGPLYAHARGGPGRYLRPSARGLGFEEPGGRIRPRARLSPR
ncbi:MoxR family ATPase [Nitrospinae bacterium AH_259_B05_G02_I21]|nr:MoxR family ATPase [Nitrospinae bacterium AH_259_B05_G02_I21]